MNAQPPIIHGLHVHGFFEAPKIKCLGNLPGFDQNWARNAAIRFLKAPPNSAEFRTCPWWIGLSADNEARVTTVPFQPEDRKILIEGEQLQVKLTGKTDPKTGCRLSDLKVIAKPETLESIKTFILSVVIDGTAEPRASGPVFSANPAKASVPVGIDDKENMSSGSAFNPRANEQQRDSIKVATAAPRPISAPNFYGPKKTPGSGHNWMYFGDTSPPALKVKPTSTMSSFRHSSAVGSQGNPIPSIVKSKDGSTKPLAGCKPPQNTYSKKNCDENTSPPFSSGRTNPTPFASTSRDTPNSSKPYNKFSKFDFDPENANAGDDDFKDLEFRSESPQPSSSAIARTRSNSPIGLLNLGNSCYMNAVLQALFSQPSFNYDLYRIKEDDFVQMQAVVMAEKERAMNSPMTTSMASREKAATESSLILCVLNLLRSCSNSPPDSIDRQKARLLAVKNASKKFTDSQQHDAQEFLCCVLDDLKEEHRHGFLAMKAAQCAFKSDDDANRAELAANPVAANFGFTLRKSLSCRQCDRIASETVESFNNLSVPIPNAEASVAALEQNNRDPKPKIQVLSGQNEELDLPELDAPLQENYDSENRGVTGVLDGAGDGQVVSMPQELSLQDCIDHFFQKEEIEYRPEQCGHVAGGVVSYCLASLPRVFVVHLKRFLYTMTSNVGTKCTLPVSIPSELDLSKYCAPKDVSLPKLIDSPVTPKSALKSEILSPAKFTPPSTSRSAHTALGNNCRKRLYDVDDCKQEENDENVPMNHATKRSRSDSGSAIAQPGVVPDSASDASSNDGSKTVPAASSELKQYAKYRLSAIISHTGSSSDYGHYTTDAYHSTLKRWFRFDDMAVKSITEANVLEENKWNGYIFFYTADPVWHQAGSNCIPSPTK